MNQFFSISMLRAAAGALVLAFSCQAGAATLQLSGPGQVTLGQSFDVELEVLDLGAEGLATFLIDVTFDDSLFAFEDYELGPDLRRLDDLSLGDLGGVVALGWDAFFGDVLAGPDALLATLTFQAVGTGEGTFDFGFAELVDGDPIAPGLIDVTLGAATVSAVPLPGALGMFAIAIAGLAGLRRRA